MVSAPAGIPVVVGGHDHICGAFGAGAMGPGEIVDSMGTAEASLLTLTDPPLDAEGYELGLPVGRHVLPGTLLHRGDPAAFRRPRRATQDLLGGGEEDLSRWTEEAEKLSPGEGGVCLPPDGRGAERRRSAALRPEQRGGARSPPCGPCSRA